MVSTSDSPVGSADVEGGPHAPSVHPGFRYEFPETAVATASADIGHVAVRVEVFLTGELDIGTTTPQAAADTGRWRACTLKALRAMTSGLMVTGLGTYAPGIMSGAGLRFTQTGHQFRAPNTMTFAGTCAIGFVHATDCGSITVAGDVRYSLNVTATASNGLAQDVAEPAHGGGWFVRHDEELASIGAVVLVAVPIAPSQLVAAGDG
jgi:hypothetical protein